MQYILNHLPVCGVANLPGLKTCLQELPSNKKEDIIVSVFSDRNVSSSLLLSDLIPTSLSLPEKRQKFTSILTSYVSKFEKNEEYLNFAKKMIDRHLGSISDEELKLIAEKDFDLLRKVMKDQNKREEKIIFKNFSNNKLSKFRDYSQEDFQEFLSLFHLDVGQKFDVCEKIYPAHIRTFLSDENFVNQLGLVSEFEIDNEKFVQFLNELDFETLKLIQDKNVRICVYGYNTIVVESITNLEKWKNVTFEEIEFLLNLKFNFCKHIREHVPMSLFVGGHWAHILHSFKDLEKNLHQMVILNAFCRLFIEGLTKYSEEEIMEFCHKHGYLPLDILSDFRSTSCSFAEKYLVKYGNLDSFPKMKSYFDEDIYGYSLALGKKSFDELYLEILKESENNETKRCKFLEVLQSRYDEFENQKKLVSENTNKLIEDLFCNSKSKYNKKARLIELNFLLSKGIFHPSHLFFCHFIPLYQEEMIELINRYSLINDEIIAYILSDDRNKKLFFKLEISDSNAKSLKNETLISLFKKYPEETIQILNKYSLVNDQILEFIVQDCSWQIFSQLKIPKDREQWVLRMIKNLLLKGKNVQPDFDVISFQPNLLLICCSKEQVQDLLSGCYSEVNLDNIHPLPECQELIEQHNQKLRSG